MKKNMNNEKNTSGNAEPKDGHREPEDKNLQGSDADQRIPEEGKTTDTKGMKNTTTNSADSPDHAHNARSAHDPTPNEVTLPTNFYFRSPPRDSAEARIYSDTKFHRMESQADLLSESFMNGDYIRNPGAVSRKNFRLFPKFTLDLGEPHIASAYYYMSQILATFDGPENVIWGEDGFATGYRIPGSNRPFLGDEQHAWILNHFKFYTVHDAWNSYCDKAEVPIDRYYRILMHRWVGCIASTEDGSGWKPGPANRRKGADGVIEGSVDWVITHPKSGVLYLTPHGMHMMQANILNWVQIIF